MMRSIDIDFHRSLISSICQADLVTCLIFHGFGENRYHLLIFELVNKVINHDDS